MRGLPSSSIVTASFAFCVITFEPIEVHTHSAPQNDHLNLSFVKDIYIDGEKLARKAPNLVLFNKLSQFSWLASFWEASQERAPPIINPMICISCLWRSQGFHGRAHRL